MSLLDTILDSIQSDDSYKDGVDCERIIGKYESATENTKEVINDIFISLTGYSLGTLVELFRSDYEVKSKKIYAVSDQNGHYVFYTDDYSEAKQNMNELNNELDPEEGSAAIMKLVDGADHYELFF